MAPEIVELGLDPAKDKANQATVLAALLNQLLESLGESALDAGELDAAAFREELTKYRETLTQETNPRILGDTARRCLQRCHVYFNGFQDYLVARDLEISETIGVLQAALAKVVGNAEGTNKALDETSRKFKKLAGVNDIRELRRELSKAVVSLETVVEEKRRQDEEEHAKFARQIAQLESKVEASVAEALRDPLTGVANRRGFDQTSRRWFASCSRSGRPLTVAIVDLDHFKKVNDKHGHAAGDQILKLASKCLRNGIRATDFLGRYGGEEFVILLRDIDRDLAVQRMEETLAKIAACRYEYHGVGRRVIVRFTASVGLTALAAGEDLEVVMKRADDALYAAKATGRNQVVARFADDAQAIAS